MIKFVQVPCPSSCPSSGSSGEFSYPNIFFFWLSCYGISLRAGAPRFQAGPDSRQAPIPTSWPGRKPELGQELGQGTWTNFITCFPLAEPLVQVRPGTWTRNLDNCGLPCYKLSQYYAPTPGRQSRVPRRGGNPNLDKNLDKELGQILSRVFLLQSHLSKFARGTWTRNLDNCGLPCYKLSQYYAPIPGRPRFQLRGPGRKPELGQELGQGTWHLSKFARGTWTRNLDNCGLPCYKLSQYYAPIPGRPRFRVPCLFV